MVEMTKEEMLKEIDELIKFLNHVSNYAGDMRIELMSEREKKYYIDELEMRLYEQELDLQTALKTIQTLEGEIANG